MPNNQQLAENSFEFDPAFDRGRCCDGISLRRGEHSSAKPNAGVGFMRLKSCVCFGARRRWAR